MQCSSLRVRKQSLCNHYASFVTTHIGIVHFKYAPDTNQKRSEIPNPCRSGMVLLTVG